MSKHKHKDKFNQLRKARDKNDYRLGIVIYRQIKNENSPIEESYNIILSLINENFSCIPGSFLDEIVSDLIGLEQFRSEATYTLFIKLLTLQDKLDDSLLYLSKLKEKKFKLKRRTLSPIILSCNKLNRFDILPLVIQDIFLNDICLADEDVLNILGALLLSITIISCGSESENSTEKTETPLDFSIMKISIDAKLSDYIVEEDGIFHNAMIDNKSVRLSVELADMSHPLS